MTTPIVSVNIMGGLGNQLFQIAAAYAYAKQTHGSLQIVRKMDNGNRPVYWDSVVYRIQPYLVSHIPSNLEHWHEPLPTQYREIGALPHNGIYLNGYLQSSKYYGTDEIKEEIKALFRPHPRLLADICATYSYLIKNKDKVIVVHSRRTDYITYRDVHGPLEANYYKEAIGRMMKRIEKPIFLLCGDDPAYWNEIRADIPDVFDHEHIILRHDSDIRTFTLLQQFQNFIMSNSTFIWWCVWLSSAKNVMAPSKWFGPAGPAYYEDIYEETWERI
jgi:hypothetical protein